MLLRADVVARLLFPSRINLVHALVNSNNTPICTSLLCPLTACYYRHKTSGRQVCAYEDSPQSNTKCTVS